MFMPQSQALDFDDLPEAVYTTTKHPDRSARFQHIQTAAIVAALMSKGFKIVNANVRKCRKVINRPYAKHLVQMRHPDYEFDILIINDHGATGTQVTIMLGFYRIACANDLIVGNTNFMFKARHLAGHVSTGDIIDGTFTILEKAPTLTKTIEQMETTYLKPYEQKLFAIDAVQLRWPNLFTPENYTEEVARAPQPLFDYDHIISPIRFEDEGQSVWTTYNILQEKLVNGYLSRYNPITRKETKVRAVKSINTQIDLNTKLWNLAERYLEAA